MAARNEAQALFEEGLGVAKEHLGRHGGFAPYALILGSDRKVRVQHVEGGDGHEALAALESSLRQGARQQSWRAVAIFVDTRITPRQGQAMRAVMAGLEHREGYTADIYVPYTPDPLELGEMMPSMRTPTVMV